MGSVGYPGRVAYCASKHAVDGITRALAVEWARDRIRVNAVAPTFVLTPMTAPMFDDPAFREIVLDQRLPIGRLAIVEDVARAVRDLSCDASENVTGHMLQGRWRLDRLVIARAAVRASHRAKRCERCATWDTARSGSIRPIGCMSVASARFVALSSHRRTTYGTEGQRFVSPARSEARLTLFCDHPRPAALAPETASIAPVPLRRAAAVRRRVLTRLLCRPPGRRSAESSSGRPRQASTRRSPVQTGQMLQVPVRAGGGSQR